MALRKADLTVIEATKKQAFHLLHPDVLAAIPRSSTPSVAAVYLPPNVSQATSNTAWVKALATGDEALISHGSKVAGLGRAPPAATGAVTTRALLEKQFVGRQQAAAQGMLSMLQLRCDGARHSFEARSLYVYRSSGFELPDACLTASLDRLHPTSSCSVYKLGTLSSMTRLVSQPLNRAICLSAVKKRVFD